MKTIFVALQQLNLYITPRKHNAGEVLFRGQTASQDVAATVEAEARRRGFYIGKVGHGGNDRGCRGIQNRWHCTYAPHA